MKVQIVLSDHTLRVSCLERGVSKRSVQCNMVGNEAVTGFVSPKLEVFSCPIVEHLEVHRNNRESFVCLEPCQQVVTDFDLPIGLCF